MKIKLPGAKPAPKNLTLGISQAEEVKDDLEKLRGQASRQQDDLRQAADTLQKTSERYQQLEASYRSLLCLLAGALLKQEALLTDMEAVRKDAKTLAESLESLGVQRFSPIVGNSVGDDCTPLGTVERNHLVPGSVAEVVSDGFKLKKTGEVILPAIVMESTAGNTATATPSGPAGPGAR